MRVAVKVRVVNSRSALKPCTYRGILDGAEGVQAFEEVGMTRPYPTWKKAAEQAIKLALNEKHWEIVNLDVIQKKLATPVVPDAET